MTYALLDSTGNITEYPVFQGDIQNRFPNTSFPIPFVPPVNYVVVELTPQPQITYAQNVVEDTPEDNSGSWRQRWSITDATPEQIAQRTEDQSQAVRDDRNQRLTFCDWTQLPDSPADHETWATYRQELRDVTAQPGFPWDVVWPEAP
jgi:hypothetical protein